MSSLYEPLNDRIQRIDAKILAALTQVNDCRDLVIQRVDLLPGIPPGQVWRSYVLLVSLALWRQDRNLFYSLYSSFRSAQFSNPDLRTIFEFASCFFKINSKPASLREKLDIITILAQKFRNDRPAMNILLPMLFFLTTQTLAAPEKLIGFLRCQLLSIYTLREPAASAIPGWACLFVHHFCYGQYTNQGVLNPVASRAKRVMETPLSRLVEAVYRHVANPTLPAPDAEQTIADFQRAYAAGYNALAGVIAGLALRDPGTADAAKTFLDGHRDLWVPVRPALIRGPWEPTYLEVSKVLEKVVQAKVAARTDKPRKHTASAYVYSWKLAFKRDATSLPENLYKLTRLSLYRSRLLKNGSVSGESAVRVKQILDAARKGELVSGGFPEQLAPLVLDISHDLYGTSEFSVHSRNKLFLTLLEHLQGLPDIVLVPDWDEYRYLQPSAAAPPEELLGIPVNLTCEDLPLKTKYTPEGNLSLYIPLALHTKSLDRADASFALIDPGSVRVLRISETVASLYAALRKHTTEDELLRMPSLTIPAAAAKEAADLLAAAAGGPLRLQGAISDAGDETTFGHIAAAVAPAVRLQLDKDDILHVSLRNRIHPKADVWCLPGHGKKSVALTTLVPPVLADRDFAAETAAADPVRKAMEPFSGFKDGEDTWTVDDLENALAVLETLHEQNAAVPVEWIPRSIRRFDLRNVASARLDDAGGAEFWLGVKGDIRLDNGEAVRLTALLAALRTGRKGPFVRMGENAYLRLSKELVRRLEALNAAGEMKGETLRVNPAALPMLEKAFRDDDNGGVSLPGELAKRLARVREAFAANPRVPESIRATLRPYQDEGFRWMWRLAAAGIGSCLADDMGLGKTLQTITLLQARAAGGPSLVIAPASVCDNWIAELRRFAPRLQPVLAREDDAYIEKPGAGMVVVASYGFLQHRLMTFSTVQWNGLVLDEAQAIKNAASKRARSVKTLKATFRVAATGTPIENNLDELWSLFDFLNPGLLLSHDAFVRTFTEEGRPLPALKKLIKPLILRRLKRDVLDDLPEKTEITLRVDLSKEERTGYEACRVAALQELEQSDENDRIGILAQLMRLRRYCCLPELVLPEIAAGAKMEALDELLSDLHDNQHRTLVFSQFVDVLQHIKGRMAAKGWTYQYLDGKTPAATRAKCVEAFQRGEGDFFLISLKAGGLGLNLTAANYVVLVDPWWNPAVENQAADRAHRIGQRHPVTVYRLVTRDTIEERVLELHARKKELAESLLEGTGDSRLTRNDLLALFRQ